MTAKHEPKLISVEDGVLVVRVKERAVEGAANEGCIRALAQHLQIPQTRIELVRGARAKQKIFRIS